MQTLVQQRQEILAKVRDYAAQKERAQPFFAGVSSVPPAGKVLDADAYVALTVMLVFAIIAIALTRKQLKVNTKKSTSKASPMPASTSSTPH